jgi:hypothetical protein
MRRLGKIAGLVLAVLTAAGLPSTPAGAAVVFGSNLAASPNTEVCLVVESSCTYSNSTIAAGNTAPGGLRAPIDGILVSWRVSSGKSLVAPPLRLRVIHEGGTGGDGTAAETFPKLLAGIYSYSARLPVRKGDQLGIDVLESNSMVGPEIASFQPETLITLWSPALIEGQSRPAKLGKEVELLINATIEPDADGDGYGDETQDGCPTLAGPLPCPVTRPDTVIKKGPKGTIDARTATFRFKSDPPGAGFECKLDKGRFKGCRSPKTYKRLAPGKHKFSVRAFNAGGRDPFPATRSFKVAP